jgi:hypothetical protein
LLLALTNNKNWYDFFPFVTSHFVYSAA